MHAENIIFNSTQCKTSAFVIFDNVGAPKKA